jgi:uncharacterized membrane protein YeaQ/YmgE (transglycosylase-associated protein family)
LQEIAGAVLAYFQGHPALYIGMAFVAGFLAHKTVVRDAGSAFFLSAFIGAIGFLLGNFLFFLLGLCF